MYAHSKKNTIFAFYKQLWMTWNFKISQMNVCIKLSKYFRVIFSSPKPKVQVSFSDHNLSIISCFLCRRCCRWRRRSRRRRRCRKLFTFSSSPELLDQFKPNLVQTILGWRGFKFVLMKDHNLFQGKIITEEW